MNTTSLILACALVCIIALCLMCAKVRSTQKETEKQCISTQSTQQNRTKKNFNSNIMKIFLGPFST